MVSRMSKESKEVEWLNLFNFRMSANADASSLWTRRGRQLCENGCSGLRKGTELLKLSFRDLH